MVESYKYKSKAATAVSFIAMYIIYLGQDGLHEVLPPELVFLVPFLFYLAGYIVTQTTEDTRVFVAEKLVKEKITQTVDDINLEEPETKEEENIVDDDGV